MTLEQQMGDLPKEKFDVQCKPFTHLCVDLVGPYMVKAINNTRLAYKQGTDAFLIDWNEFCESDDRAKYLEDEDAEDAGVPDEPWPAVPVVPDVLTTARPDWNEPDDTEEVGVPDDTRPAEPDVQQLQALPLYALLAQLESGPGNNYESDHGLTIIDPMLSHLNIQDCVTRDCLVEQDETETKVQDEMNAKDTTLSVHKNLEMCVLDAVPKDSVNERVEATTGTQDNMNATVGVQDLGKLGALDDINTANESIDTLETNEAPTECDAEEELQSRLKRPEELRSENA